MLTQKSLIKYHEQLPPQHNLAEEILLGGILMQTQVIKIVIKKLFTESFAIETHQLIYKTIVDIYFEYNYIDSIILINKLWELNLLNQIGGINKILNLLRQAQIFMSKNVSSAKIEYYIELVQDKYLRRLLIQYGYNIIHLSYITSIPNQTLLFKADRYFNSIKKLFIQEQNSNIKPLLTNLLLDLQSRDDKKTQLGLQTGFHKLDNITVGLKNSDLIIIAGRPSMGKTSLSLNIALNILKQGYKGISIFSLEMPKDQILYKLLSIECQIPLHKIITNKINNHEWKKIQTAGKLLIQSQLHIDDTANLSLHTLQIKASILNDESSINLIIVDYLQLLQLKNNNVLKRSEELSLITRSLKILAKELSIPIIILSQLNRNVESRINKIPILSDLRESGCLQFNTKLIKKKYSPLKKTYSSDNNEQEEKNILKIKQTHNQYIYEIRNYSSSLIQLTHNHYLLNQFGWIKSDHLKSYSSLLSQIKYSHLIRYQHHIIKNIHLKYKSQMYDIEINENKFLNTNDMIYTHNSIEQDADLVLFLYRNSYYNDNTDEKNLTEIIVAKHRNGPIGTAQLNFNATFASFNNLAE